MIAIYTLYTGTVKITDNWRIELKEHEMYTVFNWNPV